MGKEIMIVETDNEEMIIDGDFREFVSAMWRFAWRTWSGP